MEDEEDPSEDQEYFLEPWRDEVIREDALHNIEVLKEKTINFEQLLNELVRQGGLSFEEKFKIQSGIVDENTAGNKTVPEKCNELYQTILLKKKVPLHKLLKCWEESGNSYLVGRFDTHFALEGRDSKSLKFQKFKALPSHRTEFLTHLYLRQLTLSPHALLKCLRKSSRLVSIKLERIKVPYGGRDSDDPSSGFDQPLILPNLKEFFFEEISKYDPKFACIKDVNFFLDELNLKPILFFGLNSNMAWEAGIHVEVRMRGATLLKMQPSAESSSPVYQSMLRRRPADYGGFINPKECPKMYLYECYVPRDRLAQELTNLILYRCKVSDYNPLLSKCPNLVKVVLYSEYELNNVAELDLASLLCSKDSLKDVILGYVSVSISIISSGENTIIPHLNNLVLDCCCIRRNFGSSLLDKLIGRIDQVIVISCSPQLLNSFVSCKIMGVGVLRVYDYAWDATNNSSEEQDGETAEPDDDTSLSQLQSFLSLHFLRGKDTTFSLERRMIPDTLDPDNEEISLEHVWNPVPKPPPNKKSSEDDIDQVIFDLGDFSQFIPSSERKFWLGLPFKEGGDLRKEFREGQGF